MMRSLWTSASGMTTQQLNVDTISSNLANVNTAGFKKERLEFKSLLYQTLQRTDLDPATQTGRPVNLQVGLGVRPIATARNFKTGNVQVTNNMLDFALLGEGFFAVQRSEGEIAYTRDGSFKVSYTDAGSMLVSAEGYPLLNVDGEPVVIPTDVLIDSIVIDDEGRIQYSDPDIGTVDLGIQIDIVQFGNVQGLEAIGGSLFKQTAASGDPLSEAAGETSSRTVLVQGALEMSNVQVAEEMVNLIIAQRAYELNSKVIQTSDDMLQQAANLKR